MALDTNSAALFVAAYLASSPKIAHPAWARIIAGVRPFDIHSPRESAEGLTEALRCSNTEAPPPRPPRKRAQAAAALLAEAWLAQGVEVVTKQDIGLGADIGADLPPILFSCGDRSLLDGPAAAVLNSRKPRKITPHDAWVLETVRLARYALAERFRLISSYGTVPYGLVSILSKGSPLIAVCPDCLPFMQSRDHLKRFFQDNGGLFLTKRTLFLSPFLPGHRLSRQSRYAERDRLVGALAAVLLVADVRSGGNMEAMLLRARSMGKRVVENEPEFFERTPGVSARPRQTVSRRPPDAHRGLDCTPRESDRAQAPRIAPGVEGPARSDSPATGCVSQYPPAGRDLEFEKISESRPMLVHYTRACPGPWPGQTPAAYLRSLIDGALDAGHSAFDTLRRILRERLIRGSSRLTRGNRPVVSFTECMPEKLTDLVRWRTGLVRKWFEPYGIGIRFRTLRALGVEKVIYGDEKVYRELVEEKKHLFQLCRPSGQDWSVEREWRLDGSLNLAGLGTEDLIVIVQTDTEAAVIRQEFGARVVRATIRGGLAASEAGIPDTEKLVLSDMSTSRR